MYRDNPQTNEVNRIEFSKEITMPFGKHKGKAVRTLPTPYLVWLTENIDLKEPLLSEIEATINQTLTFDDCAMHMLVCGEITHEQADGALMVYRRYQGLEDSNG